jgi:hypothetical protein
VHPAVFTLVCLAVGLSLALGDWVNLLRFGFHVDAGIHFGAWGVEFLISGILCWIFWRFLFPAILKARFIGILVGIFLLTIGFGIVKEMLFAVFFPNLPLDRAHMQFWARFAFHWKGDLMEDALLLWCGVLLLRCASYYQALRDQESTAARLEMQLEDAKSLTLRTELDPDFLFNSMNSISGLMRADVKVADTMLGQLGDLLRVTSERADVQFISLREELDFVEMYACLQDQRYPGRVKREIFVDSGLYAALIPAMILQPIVEGAYACATSRAGGDCELSIRAHLQGDRVNIVVIHSGHGLAFSAGSPGTGVELVNVESRLRLHYDNSFRLEASQIDATRVGVAMAFPFELSRQYSTV